VESKGIIWVFIEGYDEGGDVMEEGIDDRWYGAVWQSV